MFEIFNIHLPKLSTTSGLELRQHRSAFGLSEEKFAYLNGVRFAYVLEAKDAYSNIETWLGSKNRSNWIILLTAPAANEAATNDKTWATFLAGLVSVLSLSTDWQVVCESICDQFPIEQVTLSPENLSQILDSYRSIQHFPISFRASAS